MAGNRNAQSDVVVIGGGIAGLTAAWHCARRGLSVVLLEALPRCGGLVAEVDELEDWPSTRSESGAGLSAALAGQIAKEGGMLVHEAVTALEKAADGWSVQSGKVTRRARRVIVASGGRQRLLGVPGEDHLLGKGISQSPMRDGACFKGQDVAVVGGGDSAMQAAVALAEHCRTVHIVVRSQLGARRAWSDRAAGKMNVRFIWDSEVCEVLGDKAVTGLRLRDRRGSLAELGVVGLFAMIGLSPEIGYIPASIRRDPKGRLVTDESQRCSDAALIAAGAVRSGCGGDLSSAAGEGALAAATAAGESPMAG